jgi:hypothetical protein
MQTLKFCEPRQSSKLPTGTTGCSRFQSTVTAGEDPNYHDGFQQMQEEVNRLSGADATFICELAEHLLTSTTKDIRVAAFIRNVHAAGKPRYAGLPVHACSTR